MVVATLRSLTLPRFALRRDEAAAALAISPSTFDLWVKKGYMPPGKPVGGVVLWDALKVQESLQRLLDEDHSADDDDTDNPFNGVVA